MKLKLLLVSLSIGFSCHAQTYFSKYSAHGFVTLEIGQLTIDTTVMKLNQQSGASLTISKSIIEGGGVEADGKYLVYSNNDYCHIRFHFIENDVPTGPIFEGLVDRENNIFYDITNRQWSTYTGPDTITTVEHKANFMIHKRINPITMDSIEIQFDPKIPASVCPGFMLFGAPGGVSKVTRRSKREDLELISWTEENYSFKKILRTAKKECVTKGRPINLLYSK